MIILLMSRRERYGPCVSVSKPTPFTVTSPAWGGALLPGRFYLEQSECEEQWSVRSLLNSHPHIRLINYLTVTHSMHGKEPVSVF